MTSRVLWRQQLLSNPHVSGRIPSHCRSINRSVATSDRHVEHPSSYHTQTTPVPREFDSRWLSTIKGRLAQCFTFGMKSHQVDEAGEILRELARDWRELTVGSEGFLTGKGREGLFRHNVAWGEMQVNYKGHVNNVSYVRYAETARVNWMKNIGIHVDPANKKAWSNLLSSTGIGLILKSIKIDYKFPMTFPDKISVYHKLSHTPPALSSPASSSYSSFQLDVLILSEAHQRPAARCHEDIVTYDYRQGRKVHMLPSFMMDQFLEMWELQEESRRVWGSRVKEIEKRVEDLEKSSWDRPDAVEDMGSSG
ncbi:uncharacterized protein PADG_01571 [Paracoccidioides brasiliensis Pb18]|uniref:Thioesterase domain-containing protein n=2 Tax=Paracoccidioides brasiliensis TaxID=121759 RepID=C1G3Q5_PARBD|nr:uncharacterized protein PADG_01571 [Paracoccidioides brasiliensis Pb18]EEH45421.2 hypothetical protein PADG_01571 [Paracoccidioides brasiliensis Pb18]ODH43337.1 hypothetical protein ACO22_01057 [Paracoccidioides brasiliensis]ODH50221.1 hypothetical protein GX48_03643 [Paracoccidioides brasiliensis]